MGIVFDWGVSFSSTCQTEIALGMNKDDQSFRNLSLSFRGAERQAPTVLQIALRFSKIMERQSGSMSGNTEARLKRVVTAFNISPGLHPKHQLDADKERTVLNLIVGTCKDCGFKIKSYCRIRFGCHMNFSLAIWLLHSFNICQLVLHHPV